MSSWAWLAPPALLIAGWLGLRWLRRELTPQQLAHPEQVMRRWLSESRIPLWPIGWLVNRYIETVIGHRFDDIARVKAPVLLVHSREDDVVPRSCAEQLKDAAFNATLLVVTGQNDSFADEAGLNDQVLAWLAGHRRQERLQMASDQKKWHVSR